MDFDALCIPECPTVERTVRLSKAIPAIELVPVENCKARLGTISEIPEGARLEICGCGFNQRTIKARFGEDFYFVFLRDLEQAEEKAAGARSAAAS
jgi:hypothetical protein